MNCPFFAISILLSSCSLLPIVLASFPAKQGLKTFSQDLSTFLTKNERMLYHSPIRPEAQISRVKSPAAINSDVEELEQEVYKLQQQLHMAEEELRKYEPDPTRFTTMEECETCEKQLMDTLTRVNQRRERILSDQLSSYEASAIQHQNMGGPFVNDDVGGWLAENGPNQAQLFDASAHSSMYETLLQASSSSSNQNNNMGACHVSNPNGDMFQEWAQAYASTTGLNPSALFPPMQPQHGVVGPNMEETEIPVTTREAQADHEVSDYDIRMPQLSSQ